MDEEQKPDDKNVKIKMRNIRCEFDVSLEVEGTPSNAQQVALRLSPMFERLSLVMMKKKAPASDEATDDQQD
jgi:hypothetical protein